MTFNLVWSQELWTFVVLQERDFSAGGRRRWDSSPNIPADLPPVDHLHGEARQVLSEGP